MDIDNATQDDWEYAIDVLDDFLPSKGIPMIFPIIIVGGHKMIQGFSEKELHALAREILTDKIEQSDNQVTKMV